jgi:HSP20 family protein
MLPTPPFGNPFGVMRSFMDQMDRFFDDFMGLGGGRSRQPGLSPAPQATGLSGASGMASLWYPQIEVMERNGNLVICADLPGMRKEDVHLEVHDNYLALQGERHQEQQGGQEGYYRSERSYGRFFRTVPLPEGINPDQARASFKDGVLEVTVPLPNREQKQGRRIEIQ